MIFRNMEILTRIAIMKAIIDQIGHPKDSKAQREGDLFVYPVDTTQQDFLLEKSSIV